MRLIDIEAINWYDDLFLKGVNHSGVWVRYRDVEKLIRNAPIVDAVPVRHGHWIKHECSNKRMFLSCSCCGQLERNAPNYCPNCGAKMDGGET